MHPLGRTSLSQNRTGVDQFQAKFGRNRPNVVLLPGRRLSSLGQHWPQSAKKWSSGQCLPFPGQFWAKFRRHRAKFGRYRAAFGRIRRNISRSRPKSARFRAEIGRAGLNLSQSGAQGQPSSGQFRPGFGRILATTTGFVGYRYGGQHDCRGVVQKSAGIGPRELGFGPTPGCIRLSG